MEKLFIASENVEGLPLSEAVKVDNFVFVSGMVGFEPDGKVVAGGVGAETARIFEDLRDVLGRAGASITDLVKISVYLTDAADFDAFNAVYAEQIGEKPPARVCVVSALTIDARVEMDFIAHIDS